MLPPARALLLAAGAGAAAPPAYPCDACAAGGKCAVCRQCIGISGGQCAVCWEPDPRTGAACLRPDAGGCQRCWAGDTPAPPATPAPPPTPAPAPGAECEPCYTGVCRACRLCLRSRAGTCGSCWRPDMTGHACLYDDGHGCQRCWSARPTPCAAVFATYGGGCRDPAAPSDRNLALCAASGAPALAYRLNVTGRPTQGEYLLGVHAFRGDSGMCQQLQYRQLPGGQPRLVAPSRFCSVVTPPVAPGDDPNLTETGAPALSLLQLCLPAECNDTALAELLGTLPLPAPADVFCSDDAGPGRYTPRAAYAGAVVVTFAAIALCAAGTAAGLCHDAGRGGDGGCGGAAAAAAAAAARCAECWDTRRCAAALFAARPAAGVAFLDAVRAVSQLWVILYHSYLFPLKANPVDAGRRLDSGWYMFVKSGVLAVDTFFWLSGFLGARVLLREVARDPRPFARARTAVPAVLRSYLKRYLRLTAPFAFCMLWAVGLVPHLLVGAKNSWWYTTNNMFAKNCSRYWWASILYVQNLHPRQMDAECMSWTWYLANDFQFSLYLPLVVIPFALHAGAPRARAAVCAAVAAAIAASVAAAAHRDTAPDLTHEDDDYVKPWLRCPPHLWGILTALLLHRDTSPAAGAGQPRQRQGGEAEQEEGEGCAEPGSGRGCGVKAALLPPPGGGGDSGPPPPFCCAVGAGGEGPPPHGATARRAACYATGGGLLGAGVVLNWYVSRREFRGQADSTAVHRLYAGWYSLTWGLGLSLVCSCWAQGHGGAVRSALEHPAWAPLGKLSYGSYLWHPVLIFVIMSVQENPMLWTDMQLVVLWSAAAALSFVAAAASWLLVEQPAAHLVALLRLR